MSERDGRSLSRMDPETKAVHALLERWGRWCFDTQGRLPAKSIIWRLMVYGPHGASQQGKPILTMPDDIARVDAAIAKLVPNERIVLRAYYMRETSIECCAAACHCSLSSFQRLLRRGRWRVAGYLESHPERPLRLTHKFVMSRKALVVSES